MKKTHLSSAKSQAKNEQRSFLESVSTVLRHHGAAETSFRLGVLHAAIAGLELQHQKAAVKHGEWLKFCEDNYGERLSDRLAQKYMQVAEGLKLKARCEVDGKIVFSPSQAERDAFMAKRVGRVTEANLFKLVGHFDRRFNAEVWRLLECAPSKLSEAQRERLAAAVESIADGETMASLVEAYRLTKRATGSGSTGGYKPDPERVQVFLRAYHPALVGTLYTDLDADVQAAFRKWVAAGETDEVQMALNFCAPVLSLFEDPDFVRAVDRIPITEAETMLAHAESLVAQLRTRLKSQRRFAA